VLGNLGEELKDKQKMFTQESECPSVEKAMYWEDNSSLSGDPAYTIKREQFKNGTVINIKGMLKHTKYNR